MREPKLPFVAGLSFLIMPVPAAFDVAVAQALLRLPRIGRVIASYVAEYLVWRAGVDPSSAYHVHMIPYREPHKTRSVLLPLTFQDLEAGNGLQFTDVGGSHSTGSGAGSGRGSSHDSGNSAVHSELPTVDSQL
jgi:hypothetical protein